MANSVKLLLVATIMVALSTSVSAGVLENVYPIIMQEYYNFAPNKEIYHFNDNEADGSNREEMGFILNPDTPDRQLLVIGTYSSYDEKNNIDAITAYTADKDGYMTRYMLKHQGPVDVKTPKRSVG